jgi:hypothetical protein
MEKFIVEFRQGNLYLKNSEIPLQIKEGASFSIKIDFEDFDIMPEFEEVHCELEAGTKLGFRLSGVEIKVQLEILEPLKFTFTEGKQTEVNTKIRCRAMYLESQPRLFEPHIEFEPFETDTLHDLYSRISSIYKPDIQHHNVHVVNHFYVLKNHRFLTDYCNNKTLFL